MTKVELVFVSHEEESESRQCDLEGQRLHNKVFLDVKKKISYRFKMAALLVENGKSKDWGEVYQEIKQDHDEAYSCIDKAIKLDEEGKFDQAILMYEFGLNLIDKALGIAIECPTKPDINWEKTYVMIQKMRKTRKEIQIRIDEVQAKPHPDAVEPPPSYEEAMAAEAAPVAGSSRDVQIPGTSKQNQPYVPLSAVYDALLDQSHNVEKSAPSYAELNNQLGDLKLQTTEKEIIYSHDNVRLYFIAPDGRVSSSSEPNTLIIGKIKGESESDPSTGRIYLQVGSWVYPLIPEVSPCYRSDYGAFILPDVHSGIEGAAVGLILPEDADESVHELLNLILNGTEAEGPKAPPRRSKRTTADSRVTPLASKTTFSTNLVKGATYIANSLVRGAGSTARFMDMTTPRIIDRINPAEQAQPVNPTVEKTVKVAKNVTGTAADVTGYLASKLGLATSALGRYLAPHIQKQGTKLLTTTTNMTPEEASKKVDSFLDVTSGTVEGIATVYTGLETAASLLGRSLSNNTVQIIQYKYGQPTGELANDAISTAGNAYYVYHNTKVFKPKGIAKAAAKGAGKAVLEDYRNSVSNDNQNQKPHEEFQGSGPGDGSGFLPLEKK